MVIASLRKSLVIICGATAHFMVISLLGPPCQKCQRDRRAVSQNLLFLPKLNCLASTLKFSIMQIKKPNVREKTIEFTFNTAKEHYPVFHISIASFD